MAEIKIYANYGCLAAEKRTVYTFGTPQETAVTSDEVTVRVPDGWELSEAENGQTLVTAPWGWTYQINEVLSDRNDKPVFAAIDSDGKSYTSYLEVIE